MEKKNYIVGIDIGSSNIVMIVGSKNEVGEMVVEAIAERASKGVNAGKIENINLVSECVKEVKSELEERLKIRISEAYAGFSSPLVRCAPLSDHVYIREPQNGISQTDVDALFLRMKEVVAPENEVILERVPQKYVVGGVDVADPVGTFGSNLAATFNFILCEKTPLERLKMVFRHSGMALAGLFVNPMITAEALLSEDEKSEGVAVVDIGGGSTDVTVYHGNIIRHVATIPMGANSINHDIHTHGVPDRDVERLKRKYASAIAEVVPEQKFIQIPSMGHRSKAGVLLRNLAAIVEARLTDIAEFVKDEIKDSGYARRLPFGVVLTGGSAAIENIDELFRRVLGCDVRVASASYGLDEDSRNGIETPEYTAAVALLLKGAEHGPCMVSTLYAPSMGATAPTQPISRPTPQPTPQPQPQPQPTSQYEAPKASPTNETQSEENKPEENGAQDSDTTTSKKRGNLFGGLMDLFDKGIKKATEKINDGFSSSEDDEPL